MKITSLMNLIAKKTQRRARVKGTSKDVGFSINNAAKRLLYGNFGLTFSNPAPARAGVIRESKRLATMRSRRASVRSGSAS